ncbi:hypothetical protein [Limnoglobus roseus]|uniref:Uncharacterized protein n=1 Tax=Limnoglobus roseus TaxID=2598579 RepID=A0A5C1AL56_9BACT|nr:hypothetical protein [Limnoglobus roseus]QEL20129.1 hypothetical protein PX52LOC_07217 [Limnoglobus roseus]
MKSLVLGLLLIATVTFVLSASRDYRRDQREIQRLTREAEQLDVQVEAAQARQAMRFIELRQENESGVRDLVWHQPR